MLETLRHIFGFCGEPHPTIAGVAFGAPFFSYIIYKLKKITRQWKENNS